MVIKKDLPFDFCDECTSVRIVTTIKEVDMTVSCGNSDICVNAIRLYSGETKLEDGTDLEDLKKVSTYILKEGEDENRDESSVGEVC